MPGIISTGNHPKLLWPGVHATYGQVYNEHPKEYSDLYDELDSSMAYEEDVQITGFGLAPIKTEGRSIEMDSEVQGAISRYTHIAYALGYAVTKEELDDNLYEIVATRRAKALAFSMTQTLENIGAFLYNNAFSTTYFTTADAAALCSASHVNATGGNYSNALTPAADLSEAAIEAMLTQVMGATNDRGLPISLMAQSLHVPRQEWFNANRILQSVLQSGSSNNDINVLKATNALPKGIKMNHYFTSSHAWFVRTNCPSGMQMFWRARPDFSQDNDWSTKNALAGSYMRLSVGCTDPRGIFGSDGP